MPNDEYVSPDVLPDIDPVNLNHLENYRRRMILNGKKPETVRTHIWRIYPFLKFTGFNDFKVAGKEELEEYYLSILNVKSESTIYGEVQSLKLFCDFIQPDKREDYFSDIKPRRPKVPPKDPITWEDIDLILGVIENLRDKVLLKFMFETGARRSEIVNVRIKDVRIHQNYGEVLLRGKTGERMVEFINCIPDVQEWLRHHKFNKDPDSPLFNTLKLAGDRWVQENKPLNPRTVSIKFKDWKNKAGLTKIFTPKAVRSGSATYYSQIFTQKEMETRYGWVAGSSVANIHYIQAQKSVMRNKLLSNAGIEEPEERKDDYKPRICPRCTTINSYDAIYCNSCSLILDREFALKQQKEDMMAQTAASMLMQQPDFQAFVAAKLASIQNEQNNYQGAQNNHNQQNE